jgi:ATP-dependent RNA helicase RhlE
LDRRNRRSQQKQSPTDFKSLGVHNELLTAISAIGYVKPTPIQARAIPILLEGRDLLGIAQTGTGKTAAFALPILQMLDASKQGAPQALILAPTRELALQIFEEIERYKCYSGVRTTVIFGGVGSQKQINALAQKPHIIVATPGRLLDLVGQKKLDLGSVCKLVLDEADRLLDMGFIRDIRRIIADIPTTRQSLFFSATMPPEVDKLSKEILRNPQRVDVSPEQVTVSKIDQKYVVVDNADKRALLKTMLHDNAVSSAIVFTRTKHRASRLAKQLDKAGVLAESLHGDKSQNARQRALKSFKDGKAWVLVATDIAARGIDIDGVSHVFNYELPHEPESYVHRIGRTGRAGAHGVAWSLVDPGEMPRLKAVERLTRQPLTLVEASQIT